MTHDVVALTADALATYRLTKLFVEDKITSPIRDFVIRKSQWGMELITCSWCFSVWTAAGVVAAQILAPREWFVVACVLAFSAVAGFLEMHD